MSARSETHVSGHASLCGSEGELVSVAVTVEPRRLEQLLDALAEAPFPINPQIYHHASLTYVYADGREVTEPATIVEFPAYEGRLAPLREALAGRGFAPHSLRVRNLLEAIHTAWEAEPAPAGAPFSRLIHRRQAGAES